MLRHRHASNTSVTEHEHTLGFKWKSGTGHLRAATPSCIEQLHSSLAALGEEYSEATWRDAKFGVIEQKIRDFFDVHGPSLWPDDLVARQEWLVDAATETWEGAYKHNLFFSDTNDRETLWPRFLAYASAKFFASQRKKYTDNKQKRTTTESTMSDSPKKGSSAMPVRTKTSTGKSAEELGRSLFEVAARGDSESGED